MGQDFEECVAYQFEFFQSGNYTLQWNRSFGQWSAANERQVGFWRVSGDLLCCESTQGPEVPEGCVRYAQPGMVAELPLESVLSGSTVVDHETPVWEYQVRGQPIPSTKLLSCEPADVRSESQTETQTNFSPDARFVDVDGALHEVSADIRDNYPEAQWERLMSCRIRFGLLGHTP